MGLDKKTPLVLPSDRSFGLVFTCFFAVIGLLPLLNEHLAHTSALVACGVVGIITLLKPSLLRPFNRIWMRFGDLLHKIMNPIILGMMFFVFLTPFAVLARIFGWSPFPLGFESGVSTYWIARDSDAASSSMDQQF